MTFFPDAQNPCFYHCSFSDNSHNSSALQVLLSATSFGAAYDSEERYPPPKCLPKTRVDVRRRINEWADEGTTRIFWLHGPAGAGKSAVAQSICEAWAEKGQLLASFFFSRSSSTRNSIQSFVPTIACQVMHLLTGRLDVLLEAVQRNPRLMGTEACKQLEKLLIDPLETYITHLQGTKTTLAHRLFITVDGLDECGSNDDQHRILDLLHLLVTCPRLSLLKLCVFIASRPEPHIRHRLGKLSKSVCSTESLHGDMKDVEAYLAQSFDQMHDCEKHHDTMQFVDKPWPGKHVIRTLAERSGGYFIFASTVIKYVGEEGYFCVDRLKEVLCPLAESRSPESSPFMELDKLYSQVLSTARNMALLKHILQCMVIGREKLIGYDKLGISVKMTEVVTILLNLRPGELNLTIRGLHSIIWLCDDDLDDLRFYHATLQDYLLDKTRSNDFHIDYEAGVERIHKASVHLMYLDGAPVAFTPTHQWAVSMLIWSRLARIPSYLLTYIESINLTVGFKPFIEQARSWSADERHLVCGLVRIIVTIENSGFHYEHIHTQLRALSWACNYLLISPSPFCEDTFSTFYRNLVVKTNMKPYPPIQLRGEKSHEIDNLINYLDDRSRRIRLGNDDRITIYTKGNSIVVIDTRITLSRIIAALPFQESAFLGYDCEQSINGLTRRLPAATSGQAALEMSAGKAHSQPEKLISRYGVGIYGSRGGEYGSDCIIWADGSIHCTTFWKSEAEDLKSASKSASCRFYADFHYPDLLYLEYHSSRVSKLVWKAFRDQEFGRLWNCCEQAFWEEGQRRKRWIHKIYPLWLGDRVRLGQRPISRLWDRHLARKEWEKVHDWLRETLEMTDHEGLSAWVAAAGVREQQWKEIEQQQFLAQRDLDIEWDREKVKILDGVLHRQDDILVNDSELACLPQNKASFLVRRCRLGGKESLEKLKKEYDEVCSSDHITYRCVIEELWRVVDQRRDEKAREFEEFQRYDSEELLQQNGETWEMFINRLEIQEATRRVLWDEIVGTEVWRGYCGPSYLASLEKNVPFVFGFVLQ